MACLVMAVIIAMSLVLGAELGSKANPTTTTYVPRPEWYFFFLFELLRVVKPPALVFIATVGIPTVCLVLLILLPFIDRNPERNPFKRPIASGGSRNAMWVRSGPGPPLPFSPILWQARQPDCAATCLPALKTATLETFLGVFMSISVGAPA